MGRGNGNPDAGLPTLSAADTARQDLEEAEDRLRFVENEVAAGRIRGYKKVDEARERVEAARQRLAEVE